MRENSKKTRRATIFGTGSAILAVAGFGATAASGSQQVTETYEYDVDSETAIEVSNFNGSIDVDSHDGDKVLLEAVFKGSKDGIDDTSVTTSTDGGRFKIETEQDLSFFEALFGTSDVSVELNLQCPEGVAVEQVATSNGTIAVKNVSGTVSMDTSNGDIEAAGLTTIGDVNTSSGSISVTVSGIEGDTEISTQNGDIEATLGSDLDASVSGSTTNGSVTAADGLGLSVSDNEVTGTVGEGAHDLEVSSTNGDIILRDSSE